MANILGHLHPAMQNVGLAPIQTAVIRVQIATTDMDQLVCIIKTLKDL